MSCSRRWFCVLAILFAGTTLGATSSAEEQWVTYEGTGGPGHGKHVVLISGDEEYRSEETLPALAQILARHHGFKCTVLFSVNRETGEIDPETRDNIPGIEALDQADLAIFCTRFRNLPPEQMKHVADYTESGKPIIGMRTSTHAFNIDAADHPYAALSWNREDGGWGRKVLGETWVAHHGDHGSQSTRGIVADAQAQHPILRGISSGDVWGPTDVYAVRLPQPEACVPLLLGQVVAGMKADDPAVDGPKNEPMMPIAWTNTYHTSTGHDARVFATTMGSSTDFENAGVRRLLVNASFWTLGLEQAITPDLEIAFVTPFEPSPFKFSGHRRGVRPADLVWKTSK